MKKILFAIVPALLLTGCFHDFHEKMEGTGGVVISLQWEQAEDAATKIHNLTYTANGTTKSYSSVQEASTDFLQLPVGEYDILVTANMTEDDGYVVSGIPATKADGSLPEVKVALKNPASNPAQAWFSVIHASVIEGEIAVVEPKLQRLLSTLAPDLGNVPAGVAITKTLSDVAGSVCLTAQDGSGRYGVPDSEAAGEVTLAPGYMNLLPTVAGKDRCKLKLDIVSGAGVALSTICDVPRLDPGKGYTLNLDYDKLQPYMYITSSSISPWEDGWTVSGEVLNPQE